MGSSEFISQEIEKCYSVNVDHNIWALHLTRSDVKGFKNYCISIALDETDLLRYGSEEDENVRSKCEGHEDTDCEDGDSEADW